MIDPNPTALNFTLGNPFQSRQTYVTDLDRTHWGVALEWQSDTIRSFSVSPPIAYKIGVAYRRVDQQMHITGTETFSTARVTYADTAAQTVVSVGTPSSTSGPEATSTSAPGGRATGSAPKFTTTRVG